ncbi:Hsp70 family protein [Clostridium sp. BJN0013]|uniref:Hsp70 family protein n=1 Tax=Clostridium sp. BJN0013 TaxID=3236840 RepID=UPI0034C65735
MSKIIGIDLGTSTSEVAVLENGKPFVIKNKEGKLITPSVVGISDSGAIIVGEYAKEQLLVKPDETVMEVKRLMGTDKKVSMGDNEYTPQQISAHILEYLKSCAEDYIGEQIERAVITVPAYFTDEQRRATVEAGGIAGFKVERIINEPTAAALAYGIEHMEDEKHILVYDLGGGTLDVTLLEMFEGVLEVKASSGNNKLGGKDFDEKLMDMLIKDFEKEEGVDLKKDLRAVARIKEAAENCKIVLSTKNEYDINLPFIAEKNGEPIGLVRKVTKGQFEELIWELVKSTEEPINVVLKDAELLKTDIDIVLLVGGSTRIPLVKEFLQETLDKEPKTLVDPDMAVVMGAAIQAGIINNELSQDKDILITDVCPYTLGIETLGFLGGIPVADVYDIIIPRNLTIPVIKEKIYGTVVENQEKVEIKIYQGDRKKASMNNFLGNFTLSGIPANRAFEEKIKVKFMYDINGILQVGAQIVSTGKQASISIETTGVKLEEEMDLNLWKKSTKARKFKGIIKRAENMLDEYFESEEYDELDEIVRELKKAIIKEDDDEKIQELEEKLSDILFDMEE